MYNHDLHRGKNHFCCYCLQVFSIKELLRHSIKNCFIINSKEKIIIPKNGEYVKFKNCEKKFKSLFIIHANFEGILMPKTNGKENPEEPFTNKYQEHIGCSYGYKRICTHDNFSKPF